MKKIQWAITTVAILLLIAHIFQPDLKIDAVTITLLALAAIPWLAPLFKAVELPGGIKVEFSDFQKAKAKAEEVGLLAPPEDVQLKRPYKYTFEALSDEDPNLALAGLRIEIESRLKEIASSRNIKYKYKGVGALMRSLRDHNVLKSEELSVLEDLLPLLNSAVHGAKVDQNVAAWAVDTGPRILRALEDRLGETSMNDLIARWRQRDGGAVAEVGTELSEALVKSPQAFFAMMRNDPESFDAWLRGIQHHTFTAFEAKDELHDELYTAYYNRLKELILEAIQPYLNSDYSLEAKKTFDALSNIKVRTIQ